MNDDDSSFQFVYHKLMEACKVIISSSKITPG